MTLDVKLRWKQHIKKKNVMGSIWNSGNFIGCLEAILSCQFTLKSYYTSKFTSSLELRYPALGLRQWFWYWSDSMLPKSTMCIVNAPW
jgi:hypothetical protein